MHERSDHYEEEYLYLADVTHDAALIAWGKFFFNRKMKLLEDKDILKLEGQHERRTSIGENCETYGSVTVEVLDSKGKVKNQIEASKTYAWIGGLDPNTAYTYRVLISENGVKRRWTEGGLKGGLWEYRKKDKEAFPTDQEYDCRFETFPEESTNEELVFAVIGDTGTAKPTQEQVARALENQISNRGVRLVIMVGDTVYSRKSGGSGNDDFEWLTTYFQPYRRIIDHIPIFPCMGNHDTREGIQGFFLGEKQADRRTLYDNFLVTPRFQSDEQRPATREASITPGLFYRFRFGANVEFICLDTSKEPDFHGKRLFEFEKHKAWVEHALTNPLGSPSAPWRIPFSHHPPYCKGPRHSEEESNLKHDVIRLCEENGIKTFLSGHEHNFQCIDSANRNVRCFITGGAGDFTEDDPDRSTDGFLECWGGNKSGHFLIVTITGDKMTVEPVDWDGNPLSLRNLKGDAFKPSIITVKQ